VGRVDAIRTDNLAEILTLHCGDRAEGEKLALVGAGAYIYSVISAFGWFLANSLAEGLPAAIALVVASLCIRPLIRASQSEPLEEAARAATPARQHA